MLRAVDAPAVPEMSQCSLQEAVKALDLRSPSTSSTETDSSTEDDDDEPEFEASWTHEVLETPAASETELPPIEISFSASGGAFVYQMGVAAYLQDHFDLSDCHFSGCSGGSWAATLLASGTSVHKAWAVIKQTQGRLMENPRWYSGYGRYSSIIAETIKELWRDDPAVFKRVADKHLSIAVTKFPSFTPEKHTAWESLEDLTKSILASCLIPFALTGKPCISHRGAWYIDGCVTNFKGVKSDGYSTLKDVSYHAAQFALDSVRAASSTVVRCVLPSSLSKYVASRLYNAVPTLPSPHDAVATPNGSAFDKPRALIITPYTWRSQSVTAYHLSVDVDKHQQRFDDGYADARAHHDELLALLGAVTK
jgi:hypothetical protein